MLPVGREINLRKKDVVCVVCAWQGVGEDLSTGLLRVNLGDMYVYAYRCPECASFQVASKGKLLAFRPRNASAAGDGLQQNEDDSAALRQVAVEKPNRLWK